MLFSFHLQYKVFDILYDSLQKLLVGYDALLIEVESDILADDLLTILYVQYKLSKVNKYHRVTIDVTVSIRVTIHVKLRPHMRSVILV